MRPLDIPDVGLLHGDRLCAVQPASLLEELPVGARQQRRQQEELDVLRGDLTDALVPAQTSPL